MLGTVHKNFFMNSSAPSIVSTQTIAYPLVESA